MSEGKKQSNFQITPGSGPIDGLVAVAHELKTPLAIILHLASSLEDDLTQASPIDRKQSLQRIRLSAGRTLNLVQGLTISHRLNTCDQLDFGFEMEPVNVSQVCQEAMHEIMPLAKACDQKINFSAPSSPQLVVGNNDLLRGVFINLIDNAIKHNPPQTDVDVKIRRRNARVRASVRDNGPGLTLADIRRLGSSLGKTLQPMQGRSGNSGIGLYIASQMAQAMGGALSVGAVNKGAAFHVDLIQSKQLSLL
ncbi:MAG: HAMP domain-containing sensor histidine kinase [Candidatus Woesebacteria bacterium]|jgi:signal transduction histidine kinase